MNHITETIKRHKKANQQIKASAQTIAQAYQNARLRLNKKLQNFVLSSTNDLQGKALVSCIEAIQKEYSLFEENFRNEMKNAIPYVAQSYYHDALNDIGKSNNVLGKFDSKRAEAMIKDSYTHIAGATQRMSSTAISNLRNITASVARESIMTGMSRKEVSSEILRRLTAVDNGFKFVDAKGRVWNNEAYTNMLGRTVLMNAGRESYFNTCAENGYDAVRITVSGNACPKCAEWENRIVSLTGATKGLPLLQEAIDGGLFHPNCTHSTVAVGEWDLETNYNKNGRPNQGLNAEGGKTTKEKIQANQEYSRYATNQNMQGENFYNAKTTITQSQLDNEYRDKINKNTTLEQKDAIESLTSAPGHSVNSYLRDNSKTQLWSKKYMDNVAQNASAFFDKNKSLHNITTYRTIENEAYINNGNLKVGTIYHEKGFTSSSLKPLTTFGNVVLEIDIPKNSRAYFIKSLSDLPHENEFLIDKNASYVILGQREITINGVKSKCIKLKLRKCKK